MSALDLMDQRLEYARGRLSNAERLGRPGHIERCRLRVQALEAKCAALAGDPS